MALKRLEKHGDYRVAKGSADVRKWPVYDGKSRKIGLVDGLLFDTETLDVPYAIVDVWDKRVLVALDELEIDEESRRVLARGHTRTGMRGLAEYTGGEPHLLPERVVETGPERVELLEERLEVGKARKLLGELRINKRPVDEFVDQMLELQGEAIDIRRLPVNMPATGEERVTIEGDVIRIPVVGEELVVERRPVVKEIVEIRKRPATETVHLHETVRHEEVTFSASEPGVEDRVDMHGQGTVERD